MNQAEHILPEYLLKRAIKANNEIGWRKADILEVVESAKHLQLANLGGQIQYRLPNATVELYWLSYDPQKQRPNEDWVTYCNRSAEECVEQLKLLFEKDIDKEARDWEALKNIEDINQYQVFILYLIGQDYKT